MKTTVTSIVIVNHKGAGFSATIRYSDSSKDVCLSSSSKNKNVIYDQIERHVARVTA